jgi:hypothetical protein
MIVNGGLSGRINGGEGIKRRLLRGEEDGSTFHIHI